MDRFQALQVFVKVAECGGFAAAARELAMSPPAVTRAVSALEERIDTRLLIRTTRSVRTGGNATMQQTTEQLVLVLEVRVERTGIG